jgi:hypothetical protein
VRIVPAIYAIAISRNAISLGARAHASHITGAEYFPPPLKKTIIDGGRWGRGGDFPMNFLTGVSAGVSRGQ